MTEEHPSSKAVTLGSWLVFAAVALAPLPFGSNQPVTIAFWCIVLGAAVVLASKSINGLRRGQMALAALALVIVAAYGLVLYEQLAQHPLLPAEPNPVWRDAEAALSVQIGPTVAIAHGLPWLELGRPLVCLLGLIGGFLVGVRHARARRLIKVIAWSGAAYAAYGVFSHLVDPTHVLWIAKKAYLDSVTGTFINRNTAGAYFGSCAVIWSLVFWERVRFETPHGRLAWRSMAARLLAAPPVRVVSAFAMTFLCLVALFMTKSRGAVLLSLLSLMIAFLAFFRRDLPRWTGVATALAGGGATALILLEIIGGGVNERFDLQGLSGEDRLETYKATLRIVADHPWLGTGQATFAQAFPMYRTWDAVLFGIWDKAHNTLLEIVAEMGLPVGCLVVIAWVAIFATLLHGITVRKQGILVPAAALAVALIAVLHSMIDFSLQIPGYSLVALSLVGAGLAQSFSPAVPQPGVSNSLTFEAAGAKTVSH